MGFLQNVHGARLFGRPVMLDIVTQKYYHSSCPISASGIWKARQALIQILPFSL
jgi:hypothetical protein